MTRLVIITLLAVLVPRHARADDSCDHVLAVAASENPTARAPALRDVLE